MTSDSKHFPPVEKWEAKGFGPTCLGGGLGLTARLPCRLYQGANDLANSILLKQYDGLSGKGRTARLAAIPFDDKRSNHSFSISETHY